ncbi:MAG: hypothetical protein OEY59_11025 [Deltaproteobacteria bacterium]|nr:hypothetical protein [Deltaproteobacteria bacterium]
MDINKFIKILFNELVIKMESVNQDNLDKMWEIIQFKNKYSLDDEKLSEMEIVEKAFIERLVDLINQFSEEYITLFEHNKEQILKNITQDCEISIKSDFDALSQAKKDGNKNKKKAQTDKESHNKAMVDDLGATIMDSVATGISTISDTIRKKMNKI